MHQEVVKPPPPAVKRDHQSLSLGPSTVAKHQFSSLRNMVTAESIEKVHSFQRGREKTYSSGGTLEMQEGEDD